MYRQYKKIKRKNKISKLLTPTYIIIMLIVIMIFMAIGYSYYSSTLKIGGTIKAKYGILFIMRTEDGRCTSNSEFKETISGSIWPIWLVKQDYIVSGNEVHLVIQQDRNMLYADATNSWFAFSLKNNTENTYTNGTIEEVYSDDIDDPAFLTGKNRVRLTKITYDIPQTINPGEVATIKINGKLEGKSDFDTERVRQYKITYLQENGEEVIYYFYLHFIPRK